MRILVTGGLGFIVQAGTIFSPGANHQIRIIDNFSVGALEDLSPEERGSRNCVQLEGLDWSERLQILEARDLGDLSVVKPAILGTDAVIHLSTNTGVQPSIENPLLISNRIQEIQ